MIFRNSTTNVRCMKNAYSHTWVLTFLSVPLFLVFNKLIWKVPIWQYCKSPNLLTRFASAGSIFWFVSASPSPSASSSSDCSEPLLVDRTCPLDFFCTAGKEGMPVGAPPSSCPFSESCSDPTYIVRINRAINFHNELQNRNHVLSLALNAF